MSSKAGCKVLLEEIEVGTCSDYRNITTGGTDSLASTGGAPPALAATDGERDMYMHIQK